MGPPPEHTGRPPLGAPPPAGDVVAAGAVSVGTVTRSDRAALLRLVEAATAADKVAPLSEHAMLHVRHAGETATAVASVDMLTADGDEIAGYAQLHVPIGAPEPGPVSATGPAPDWHRPGCDRPAGDESYASGELVVHPARRRRGHGRALIAALADTAAPHPVRVWAHGDLPAATALARAAGFRRVRTLWRMRRPLAEPFPAPKLPADVRVRPFVPGRDEEAWLGLNARAFVHHPEQGSWRRADLEARMAEPWFDPEGFFLAERDGRLVGFHWTKLHDAETGEVYVVGVDPDRQGTGLGRALTLIGLRYLRDRDLGTVVLYVEEDNAPAIGMYRSLGFTQQWADVMYERG